MTSELTGSLRRRVGRLLDSVIDDATDPDAGAVTKYHADNGVYGLDAKGAALLDELASALSEPSLLGGGFTGEAAEKLLLSCMRTNRTAGRRVALDELEARLAEPPAQYRVLRPCVMPVYDGVQVGSVTFHAVAPEDFRASMTEQERQYCALGCAEVTVVARDSDSALIAADHLFGEAAAILQFSQPHLGFTYGEWYAAIGRGWATTGSSANFLARLGRILGSDGLAPALEMLSVAARRPSAERTAWERRILMAARHCHTAALSTWEADKLIAYCTALESLGVRGSERRTKGVNIARRLPLVLRARRPDFGAWLGGMYRTRNDVVHGAVDLTDEREVRELGVVVWTLMHWAVQHLEAPHPTGRPSPHETCFQPCETFDQAWHCSTDRAWE